MQRYEKYKDSGVDWIGEIPKDWEIVRFKRLFKEKKKTTNASLNSGSISFGEVVYKDDEKITEATKLSYQVLNEGEFLLNPLNMNYDLKSLRIGLSAINVVVSSGYIILQSKKGLNKNYYRWLLRMYDIVFMKTLGAGVRQTINYNDLADSHLVFPSLDEQQTIATFLDDKTAKIDQTIANKQKEIELLKERRQILIQKAVTKGLDDSVLFKDSGVDWIGEIPEHWEVPKLKHISLFIYDGTHGSYPRVDVGYRLLSVRNIIDNKFVFRDDDSMVSEKDFKDISSKFLIIEGDIQLAIVGATLGKVALVKDLEEKIVTQRSLCSIRVNNKILNTFLFFYLQSKSYQSFLWNNTGFSAQPGIYLGTIQNSNLALPSKEEQLQIVSYLEKMEEKISKAILLKQQEIEKLREYKTVLIDNVVTGKMRVS